MKYVRKRKTNTVYQCIYMESRKMILMNLFAGQEERQTRDRRETDSWTPQGKERVG